MGILTSWTGGEDSGDFLPQFTQLTNIPFETGFPPPRPLPSFGICGEVWKKPTFPVSSLSRCVGRTSEGHFGSLVVPDNVSLPVGKTEQSEKKGRTKGLYHEGLFHNHPFQKQSPTKDLL